MRDLNKAIESFSEAEFAELSSEDKDFLVDREVLAIQKSEKVAQVAFWDIGKRLSHLARLGVSLNKVISDKFSFSYGRGMEFKRVYENFKDSKLPPEQMGLEKFLELLELKKKDEISYLDVIKNMQDNMEAGRVLLGVNMDRLKEEVKKKDNEMFGESSTMASRIPSFDERNRLKGYAALEEIYKDLETARLRLGFATGAYRVQFKEWGRGQECLITNQEITKLLLELLNSPEK